MLLKSYKDSLIRCMLIMGTIIIDFMLNYFRYLFAFLSSL